MSARRVARDGDIVFVDSESIGVIAKKVVCVNAIFEVFGEENFGAKLVVNNPCYNNVTSLFVSISSYLVSIISLEYFNPGLDRTFLNSLCFFIMNKEQLEI